MTCGWKRCQACFPARYAVETFPNIQIFLDSGSADLATVELKTYCICLSDAEPRKMHTFCVSYHLPISSDHILSYLYPCPALLSALPCPTLPCSALLCHALPLPLLLLLFPTPTLLRAPKRQYPTIIYSVFSQPKCSFLDNVFESTVLSACESLAETCVPC